MFLSEEGSDTLYHHGSQAIFFGFREGRSRRSLQAEVRRSQKSIDQLLEKIRSASVDNQCGSVPTSITSNQPQQNSKLYTHHSAVP